MTTNDNAPRRGRPKSKKNPDKSDTGKQINAAVPNEKVTIAVLIRQGLLEEKTPAQILRNVKKHFPEARTTAATIHNYRSEMRKQGIDVKTIRPKKSKKVTPSKKENITSVVHSAIKAGKTNDEVIATVKEHFPKAKTGLNMVVMHRTKLRKEDSSIPSSWEAKREAKATQNAAEPEALMQASAAAANPAGKKSKKTAPTPKPTLPAPTKSLREATPHSTIAIASDHAGVALKESLKKLLSAQGITSLDLGTDNSDSVDYPDYATAVAQAIAWGQANRGIVICGSGIGISIAINRYRHIRSALCTSGIMARLARQHNDANVLALGARLTTEDVAQECLDQFLNTKFEGGRHSRRIEKMS